MPWQIIGGPEDVTTFNKDAHEFAYALGRGDERRYVTVTITMPALDVTAPDVRAARESDGRTAIEGVLEMDDPPRRVVVRTDRIMNDEGAT